MTRQIFEVPAATVQGLMSLLPVAARDPDSAIFYDAGALHVPAEWVASVETALTEVNAPGAAGQRLKADLQAYAAAKRFAVETGGVAFGDHRIDTSRESQSLINGAFAYVTAADVAEVEFKSAAGWLTLTRADVQAVAVAVAAHVQACFAAERAIGAAIDAGTITTTLEIDAADWPS